MQFKSLFLALAAGLSFASAYETVTSDETTTSTSTLTKTVTITQCNPAISYCPGYNTSTTSSVVPTSYPVLNSTSSAYPTGGYHNSSSSVYFTKPTSAGYPIETTIPSPTKPVSPPASSPAEAGAAGLFVQSGLLLSVLGAGVALLA